MAERRGMGEAMALTPEKMAFITGGLTPPKPTEKPAPLAKRPAEMPQENEIPVATEAAATPHEEPAAPAPRSRPRRPARAEHPRHEPVEEGGFYGEILVPLTTRLKPRTADALRRACLEQKLARRSPNTQQEIVELALAKWLEDHRFLD